ncbi:MAG: CPBP family intramembrane metalloprotease [Nitrososphaerota archaeon]|nr:CPBP family intramembrane metalloprotease [Nitrososphaerota archaeon]
MIPEQAQPDAGAASKSATTLLLVLAAFTSLLAFLAFPAGLYTVFHGGLSSQLGYGSLVATYFWVGPVPAVLPFLVPIGALFAALSAVYAGMFVLGLRQRPSPFQAARNAFRSGVGELLGSPFLVILVSIGFLNFTAVIVSAVSQAAAGPVGNPFSGVDPLIEMGSLTFAPLREELGFRLVLIGLVALVLSIGRPPREAVKALWRPSAAYEGLAVGGATATIIWIATAASAATFGICHVTCGGGNSWNWSKLPEAVWGGVVLGYVYVKYGLHVAVLTHWGVDYLGSVYSFFGQAAYGIPASSATREFIGQYVVDVDMLMLFGLACFVLVAYLGVKRLAAGRGSHPPDFKGPLAGVGIEP